MLTLRLTGALAACARRGEESAGSVELALEARSVAEAVQLVAPQTPGFEELLKIGSWRVTVNGGAISAEELTMLLPDRAFVSIGPLVGGAGPAIPVWGWVLIGIGSAAALTKLVVPDVPEIPDTEHLDPERRTLFSGPVNSIAQGGAVPLIYGKIRVGSTVVSGGITQERPTGGDHADPDPIGLGGDLFAGVDRPRRPGRGYDDFDSREPLAGGGEGASAERSVLRVIDLLGEGEIEGLVDGLKSVWIDDVPVEDDDGVNVEGVTVQERKGLGYGETGQEALEGFDVTSTGITSHSREKVTHGSALTRTVPARYDAARVTLQFPRLLMYDELGNEVAASVEIKIEARPSNGAYTTVLTQTIEDVSLDPQDVSWRVERPSSVSNTATWQIRVSRVTANATSTKVVDEFYWQRLAGLRDVRQSYPHSALVGLTIETDRADGVNVTRREYEVKGRKVLAPPNSIWNPNTATSTSAATYGSGVWDGTTRRVWTDNPAWIVYDLLTDRRAGLGGIPGMVAAVRAARADFLELSKRCDELVPAPDSDTEKEPRWRFNGVIRRRDQARKVIDWVLSGCRAGVSWQAGAAALAIDGDSDVTAVLGNANVIDGEFEYSGLRWQERYSAVAVTWQDPEDAYRSTIELVVDDALVARYGFRQRDVAAVGCTSRGQAHRVGLLVLNEQENEGERARFRMALEGMHLRPGDRIRIADQQRYELRAAWRVRSVDTSVSGKETLEFEGTSSAVPLDGETIQFGDGDEAALSGAESVTESATLALSDGTPDLNWTQINWPSLSLAVPAALGGETITRVLVEEDVLYGRVSIWVSGDLLDAWERASQALILTAAGYSITLPGPNNPGAITQDPTAPYLWQVSRGGGAFDTWFTNVFTAINGGADWNASLTLQLTERSETEFETTDVPTGLEPGDLVIKKSAAIDWIVTSLGEQDRLQVRVETRRRDPNKYSSVEQRRMLAPPLTDPVAAIAAPTAVTIREATYEDRDQVRSALELGVQGGDDPRVDLVEWQIQRPTRKATAAEISAGDWTVLPRGPWEPLKRSAARSIVLRDVVLGGYKVRARFLGGRRRSAWRESADAVADGKADAGGPPEGLAIESAAGGYWVHWTPPDERDYAYSEIYDREGTAGAADADVDVTATGWTLRGRVSGSGFRRADVSGTEDLRVAVRHVDTSRLPTAAREVGVTPDEPIEGADGEDGVGLEHVFVATESADEPSAPSARRIYDPTADNDPEDGFTDGLTVTEENPHGHRFTRKVPGLPDRDTVPPATRSAREAAGWGEWRYTGRVAHFGVAGSAGEDGNGIEYIFAATVTAALPEAAAGVDSPQASFPFDQPTAPYTDGLTLTAEKPFGHRWRRAVPGTPAVGAEINVAWQYDGIVAHYGANALPPPENVTLSVSGALGLNWSWAGVDGAAAFRRILRIRYDDGSWSSGPVSVDITNPGGATVSGTITISNPGRTIAWAEMSVHTIDGEGVVGGPSLPIEAVPGAGAGLSAPVLTAVAGNAQVVVSWPAVSGATFYQRRHKRTSQSSYGAWATASSPQTFGGLVNGVSYDFQVRAGAGAQYSAAATVTRTPSAGSVQPPDEAAPPTPSAPSVSVNGDDVTVSWNAVARDDGGYDVQRRAGSTGAWATIVTDTSSTSFTDSNRPDGTYYYRVRAENSEGEHSSYSGASAAATVASTTPSAPPTPSSLGGDLSQAAAGANVTGSLSWSASTGATGYELQRYDGNWRPIGGGALTSGVTTVGNVTTTDVNFSGGAVDLDGHNIAFRVRALNAGGRSGWRQNDVTVNG
ncbi:MAG: hypothetical protein F4X59_17395 [Holophagales bacterium]|nr:hypothetical protein [Holophagales bacterium]